MNEIAYHCDAAHHGTVEQDADHTRTVCRELNGIAAAAYRPTHLTGAIEPCDCRQDGQNEGIKDEYIE